VVRKGPIDLITDGAEAVYCSTDGSRKRCGGIGDILSGTIGTFSQYSMRETQLTANRLLDSCAMACYVTRRASKIAFDERGHSLIATDIIEKLSKVICDI
jgi:ATP-dependent NAD(P)H-hydrate dehydratase